MGLIASINSVLPIENVVSLVRYRSWSNPSVDKRKNRDVFSSTTGSLTSPASISESYSDAVPENPRSVNAVETSGIVRTTDASTPIASLETLPVTPRVE